MIRLLLVDDHPVVRAGYQRLLEQAGDIVVVAQAGRVDQAYAEYVAHAPDVTVTDLSMPGSGGLELIRRLLARDPSARTLVFSMHDGALLVRRALDAGARGFLSKSAAPDKLIEAVRAVHAGQHYLSDDLSPALLERDAHYEVSRLESLTAREFEVFRLLAQGHTLNQCAETLNLSPKTVANYQTLVKEKLGVSTSAALVHLAIRNGVISSIGA